MGRTQQLKLPLTVESQRRLIEKADDKQRSLIIFILSTGAHPKILGDARYGLRLDDPDYFIFKRPKTRRIVQGSWSKMMKEKNRIGTLAKLRNKTKMTYWRLIHEAGIKADLPDIGPLVLRHTHFVNRARLGHDVFSISSGANTDVRTIQQFYTIGSGEMSILSDTEKKWLKELMER